MIKTTLIAVLTAFLCACSPIPPIGTAITDVTIIDAINGTRHNQTVIFEEDKIVAIQPAAKKINVRDVVDGSGKYLIPGLWDFHVHLSYDDRFTESMPALFLSYGITSVRDTGGLLEKIQPIVKTMRSKDAIAPRVYYAGPLLDGNFVVYDGNSRPEIGVRNASEQEAQAMITDLKKEGVDFIKIYELVGPGVFRAMVKTANELDLPIDSHVPLSMLASKAGPLVDSIEHLRNIELDCASNAVELHRARLKSLENNDKVSGYQLRSSLHKQQRLTAVANYSEERCDQTLDTLLTTTQVPTLRLNTISSNPPYLKSDWDIAIGKTPIGIQNEWNRLIDTLKKKATTADPTFSDWSLFLTNRMYKKGIPIAAGTDTPIGLSIPGYSLHTELEMLVKAGLPPIEALRAATIRPAEYFSLQDQIGTIDIGKKADMVLLDKDPLEDISNTKSIDLVITKGRLFKAEDLIALTKNQR